MAKAKIIEIPPMKLVTMEVTVIGDSPLIVHKWSAKAKKEMMDKQLQIAAQPKGPRDPIRECQEARYLDAEGFDMLPCVGFKNAAVTACTSLDMTKVAARQAIKVIGEHTRILGDAPVMREDMVKIGMGTSFLRYRPGYNTWYCKLMVSYNSALMSDAQVINLFNTAGFAVGVFEWRTEKGGIYGGFRVGTGSEVKALDKKYAKANAAPAQLQIPHDLSFDVAEAA